MLLVYALSMVALVGWGIASFVSKPALRTLPPLHLVVYSSAFFLLAASIMLAWQGYHGYRLEQDPQAALLAVGIGMLGTLAQILFIFAIRQGAISYPTLVTSLYPVVATLLAFFMLQEAPTGQQGIGILLGISALILMVVAQDKGEKSHGPWLLPSLAALLLWGFWAFLPKIALQTMTAPSIIFYEALGNMIVTLPILFFYRGRLVQSQGTAIVAGGVAVNMIALVCFYYALERGSVATIVTITAMYPVVVLGLARVFLHEKLNRTQLSSAFMAMGAIAMLAAGGPQDENARMTSFPEESNYNELSPSSGDNAGRDFMLKPPHL